MVGLGIVRRTLFVGRFQPPHLGHKAMFDAVLPSLPLIYVRPVEKDENNPFYTSEVVEMLQAMMPQAEVRTLPCDIDCIAYGREVGYTVIDLAPKLADVNPISATEIRRRLMNKQPVDGLLHPQVERIARKILAMP